MRDYQAIAARLTPEGSESQRLQRVADALWEGMKNQGVSWVGFYIAQPEEPEDRRLVLGPHRDKPSCSPLGLHGVCGQAMRFRTARIIADVTELGDDYIACDPRDRSEIAIPLLREDGTCCIVLDLDSFEPAAFDESDHAGLMLVLEAAGLAKVSVP